MLLSRYQKQQLPLVNDISFSENNSLGSLLTNHASSKSLTRAQRARWEADAQKGSIEATLQLVAAENPSHDPSRTACHRCDRVADLYLSVLERLSEQTTSEGQVHCSADLLVLVSAMSQMVVDHASSHRKDGGFWWFDGLAKQLWSLAKHLKDETRAPDCHVTTTLSKDGTPAIDVSEVDVSAVFKDNDDDIRRAIRITIYSCRAHVYRQKGKVDRAMVYLRKCLAVCPPRTLDGPQQQELQKSAYETLQALLIQTMEPPSRPGSISSNDSKASASATCAHCGIEKRAMPVCAKCRSQSYCTYRCLVADKEAHDTDCRPPLSASLKQRRS